MTEAEPDDPATGSHADGAENPDPSQGRHPGEDAAAGEDDLVAAPLDRAARVRDQARRWLAEIEAQREQMVRTLQVRGQAPSDAIAHAMRVVPRQAWIPTAEIHEIYDPALIHVIDHDEHGRARGSISAPWLQARVLDQAALRPGMRVLEIGSGGPGAALIATIVGRRGLVVSLDIDPAVLDRTFRGLIAAGFDDVVVLDGDGWHGAPAYAPFDRIIVTATTTDIAPSWIDQLTPDGRLVVPLRLLHATRSLALDRDGPRLHGDDSVVCDVTGLRSDDRASLYSDLEHSLGAGLTLRVGPDVVVDISALRQALAGPAVWSWTGIEVGDRDDLDEHFRLAVTQRNLGVLESTPRDGTDGGSVLGFGVPCLVEVDSLAYRVLRPSSGRAGHHELGVVGHGGRAEDVAGRLRRMLHSWDRERAAHPRVHVKVWPASTPDADLPAGRVVENLYTRAVVSWSGRLDGP